MPHNSTCNQPTIPEEACYIRFGPGKVAGAVALKWETVRGETLVVDLIQANQEEPPQIVGIELFKPGMKPCQPLWAHQKQWAEVEIRTEIPSMVEEQLEEFVPGPEDEEPNGA
jgi:hypothetical protein